LTSEATFLRDGDRVLGLKLGTDTKAYPIKILNWHEIVNDTVGGKAVVVTYCPLCGTGIAFDAKVQGRRYAFGVSGLLYQSDLLMYDHQTESLWSQIGMPAIAGPMTGQRFTPIFFWELRLGGIGAPHTLQRSSFPPRQDRFGAMTGDPYRGYAERLDLMFDTTHIDPSYDPKEWVVGVEINGAAKAYLFAEIKKVRSPISDQVAGQPLTWHFNSQTRRASVTDGEWKPLPSVTACWFTWYAFYPDTRVFRAP
jgi:uncharacterized protein DUF3179